ncbi:hypothetical protein LC613_15540 [Nostoc sphaeroides CHAB 2801]|uniref:hypothetical protein n=1 Tax=Nostoc sphaeroides TaxID=446679 RepID=UPI0015F317C2|nr:hypothetical protein [Nostoc sphaeroides]MCC5629402.1 hypothetical protein [Nostoc sphaeroides CHAB 2801]
MLVLSKALTANPTRIGIQKTLAKPKFSVKERCNGSHSISRGRSPQWQNYNGYSAPQL